MPWLHCRSTIITDLPAGFNRIQNIKYETVRFLSCTHIEKIEQVSDKVIISGDRIVAASSPWVATCNAFD